MTTSFDSPLELPQIVDNAAKLGRVTAVGQTATRPALPGGDDDL